MEMQMIPKCNILRKIIEELFKLDSEYGKNALRLKKFGTYELKSFGNFPGVGRQVRY